MRRDRASSGKWRGPLRSWTLALLLATGGLLGCKDDRPQKCKEVYAKRVSAVGKVGKLLGGAGGSALAQAIVSTPEGEAAFVARCQALPRAVVDCLSRGIVNAKGDPTCRKLLKQHRNELPRL